MEVVHFMNEGVDLADVKDWLGHRSISSTMIYAQVTNKRRDATYQRMRVSKEDREDLMAIYAFQQKRGSPLSQVGNLSRQSGPSVASV